MSNVLNEIKAYIEKNLPVYESEQERIDEMMEEGFDPCDWSGGNFDDAYEMGSDHGDTNGRYVVLRTIARIIEKEDE